MGSIEDVQYLMENSTEESYMYNVNSSTRDRRVWPYPNQYQITFDSPFRQVIGIDVVDATIPRTQYSVDVVNNSMVIDVGNGPVMIEVANGDHTDTSLIAALNDRLSLYGITTVAESNPPELRNVLKFTSPTPFHFLMGSSTIRPVLGFDEDAAGHELLNKNFRCADPYSSPGTYSSITENEVQVLAYEGPQAVELAIPFAGPNGSPAKYIAQRFVATKTGVLKEIRIACAITSDADDRVIDWFITSNDPVQEQPGTILYSGAQIPAVDYPTPDQSISGFTSSGDISSIGAAITAGVEYWLVYSCSTTVGEVDLYYGTPIIASANQLLYSSDGSTWTNGAVSGQDITNKSAVMTVVVSLKERRPSRLPES